MTTEIAELEIRRTIGSRNTPRVQEPLDQMLPAATVIAELERFRGCGVLLLTIESAGGLFEESLAIYDALRAFSRGGDRIVVHLPGYCASTAVLIALAGDVIVMDPAAVLIVHSMWGPTPEKQLQLNLRARAICLERTCTGAEYIDAWLRLGKWPVDTLDDAECSRINPDVYAVAFGWADEIGDAARAREIAVSVANGATLETARQKAMRARSAREESHA